MSTSSIDTGRRRRRFTRVTDGLGPAPSDDQSDRRLRLGNALREMASDLIHERQMRTRLERENRTLRRRLAELESQTPSPA